MKTSTFITSELRALTGLCQPVNDIVMQNLGIERMGTCSACGHEIKNHVGVYNHTIGYIYVGVCCKAILCKPDAKQINPDAGTKFLNEKNNEQIVLSESQAKLFGNSQFKHDYIAHDKYSSWTPNFENNYNGAYYSVQSNDFTRGIYSQLIENFKKSGMYFLSTKQYNCIVKFIN